MTYRTTLVLCVGIAAACFAAESGKESPAPVISLAIGDSYQDAVTLLSNVGLKPEERYYSIALPKDTEDRYIPLTDNAAIEVLYATDTKKISGLSLITSPSYRPVKGLEVHLRMDKITFDGDRSYTVVFPREKKPAK